MNIELDGMRCCILGRRTLILDALEAALAGNGGVIVPEADATSDEVIDLLLVGSSDQAELAAVAQRVGFTMLRRGSGRILFLVSAFAAVPSRRFPEMSAAAAVAVAITRTLAMRLGPAVLVNALGCGAISDPAGTLLEGDTSMLSHVPSGETGTINDIVHAALFLCDPLNSYMTGQLLTVDGGWSVGYGRNF